MYNLVININIADCRGAEKSALMGHIMYSEEDDCK